MKLANEGPIACEMPQRFLQRKWQVGLLLRRLIQLPIAAIELASLREDYLESPYGDFEARLAVRLSQVQRDFLSRRLKRQHP
jgi:hypothetical protein